MQNTCPQSQYLSGLVLPAAMDLVIKNLCHFHNITIQELLIYFLKKTALILLHRRGIAVRPQEKLNLLSGTVDTVPDARNSIPR